MRELVRRKSENAVSVVLLFVNADVGSGVDNVVLFEPEEYQALTEKEESDIETMMNELRFNPNDAEEFVEKLTNELMILDGVC